MIMKTVSRNSPRFTFLEGAHFALILTMLVLIAVACAPTAQVAAPPATAQLISPADYMDMFGDDQAHVLIDVRTPEEFATGHISGAINIAVEELASRLAEVPNDQPIIVYCRSGNRSAAAARILIDAGYPVVYDLGGIQTWVAQGFPIE
jgi:phage shock protein E